jgi:signal transduction histidine kinase
VLNEMPNNNVLICVVDDDDILRAMIRAELEADGYSVVEAVDGEDALRLCNQQKPDLMIVDVVMPRMDGFELCRRLRNQPETALLPILMATGLDDVASIGQAYEAGATDFIPKPLTWIMLIHRVRYMLRAARAFAAIRENQERLLRAIDAAETANRTKTEFLANMSHELRTPLNAIIGFSELMRTQTYGPISEQYLEYILHIGESGEHLLRILTDILEYSQAEIKRLTLFEEELDLEAVVTQSSNVIEDMARKAEIAYSVEIERNLPKFRGDASKIRQLLINLLGNAVKFTPAGGSIWLNAGRAADGGLHLLIRDTGIGIAPDKMAIALAPFGQVESAFARSRGGVGLGLPLSTTLAQLHGGALTLSSEVGKGTVAQVSLPSERFVAPPDLAASRPRTSL